MSAKPKIEVVTAKDKPVTEIRVGGVRIPIWKQVSDDGAYHKAGLPELSYRGKDDQWHAAKTYGLRDLVNLTKASMLAHSEILKRNHEGSNNGNLSPEGDIAE
jgi:hypothetical protein